MITHYGNKVLSTLCKLQGRQDDAFPDGLRLLEGKNVLLSLKRNSYNISFPKSSVSVCGFAICEDLLEEFNSAAQVQFHLFNSKSIRAFKEEDRAFIVFLFISCKVTNPVETTSSQPTAGKVSSCTDSTTPTVDLSADEAATASLDTPLAQCMGRGKRRIAASTKSNKESSSSNTVHTPMTRTEERLLKTVKQEKLH